MLVQATFIHHFSYSSNLNGQVGTQMIMMTTTTTMIMMMMMMMMMIVIMMIMMMMPHYITVYVVRTSTAAMTSSGVKPSVATRRASSGVPLSTSKLGSRHIEVGPPIAVTVVASPIHE